ncbi:MAG: hypothetical protein KatS3mg103_0267 [Phycisphaerales bacterium]|nr:MAG: hypothetical protein KatS3mg103_0267 [Phycisphaerales bacterium]
MASGVVQLGSAVVGGAFCFAAVGKALEPAEVMASMAYLAGMAEVPPPPTTVLAAVAALVAGLEWILGCWLIAGRWLRPALMTAVGFLALLTIAVVMLVADEAPVGCGCGLPSLDAVAGPYHIVRNTVLLLISGGALGMVLTRSSPAILVGSTVGSHEADQS